LNLKKKQMSLIRDKLHRGAVAWYPEGFVLDGVPSCANGDSRTVEIKAAAQDDQPLSAETHAKVYGTIMPKTKKKKKKKKEQGMLVDCLFGGEKMGATPCCNRRIVEHFQTREAADARILLEAALAAGDAGAANPVLRWLETTGFESTVLRALAARVRELR